MSGSSIPTAEIVGLQFGLLSDKDVQKLSVREINKVPPKKTSQPQPVPGTMTCTRLGTTLPTTLCTTCGGDNEGCTGHCAHLNLFQPTVRVSYFNVILKIFGSICICCSRLLMADTHPRRSRLLKLGATGSYKRCVNEVSKCTSRTKVCWFPSPEHENETPRCLSPAEAKERGYCGMRQPDIWWKYDNLIVRPAYYLSTEEQFDDLPEITPEHLRRVLRFASPTTTRIFGFDPEHSPLEALMESVMLVSPLLIRPTRSMYGKEDDITTTYRKIQRCNMQARPEIVANLTLGLLRDEKSDEHLTLTAAKKKLKHVQGKMTEKLLRKKQPVVPECLEDYYLLQRATASLIDSKYDRKLDAEYGREPFCLKRRFAPTKRSRGRMRQNMLGKPTKYTIRGVASCNTDMEVNQIAVPKQALMHCTFPVVVTELNYNAMLKIVLNGPNVYPGCNYVERNGQLLLPDANLGGLKVTDIVHCHWQNMPVIGNRQPSLHRFAIMGYEVILSEDNTIQGHLGISTALNLDFDGDEMNCYLPQDLQVLAEAMFLMNVRHNLMKDGCLVIGFVQHAVLGAAKCTEMREGVEETIFDATQVQRYLSIGWTEECMNPVLKRWRERHAMGPVTGREFMSLLLPTYDPSVHKEQLTKTTLNAFMAQTIESMDDMAYATKRISFLTRILEAVCTDFGVTIHLGDTYLPHLPEEIEAQARMIYNDACRLAETTHEKDLETEEAIDNLLQKYRDLKGNYALGVFKKATRMCGMFDSIASKAKGSAANLTQNVVAVGQQNNENNSRYMDTTSHYFPDLIKKHGFVQSSFMLGLTPSEFFFHLRAARNGLVAVACGTSYSGYVYRQLFKALESLRVSYNNSVCNDMGDIVQFQYGFDPTFVFYSKVESVQLNLKNTIDKFAILEGDVCCVEEVEHLLRLRERAIEYDPQLKVCVPVNFTKEFECSAAHCAKRQVNFNAARNRVARLWHHLVVQEHMPNEPSWELVFFEQLSTRFLLDRKILACEHVFEGYLHYVETTLARNIAPESDAVGGKGAQDPMQHMTQSTLKQFHLSGEKTVLVDSMTRLKETLNMRTVIQQPQMHFSILPAFETTFDPLSIVELRLEDVTTQCDDRPYQQQTLHAHFVHMRKQLCDYECRHVLDSVEESVLANKPELMPVLLTCYLNKPKLIRREISPRMLAQYVKKIALKDVDADMCAVTYADHRDEDWWITITIIRIHSGVLLKSINKDWKTLCLSLPLPMLSQYLRHTLLHSRQLLAGVDGIKDFVKTKRTLTLPDEDDDNRLRQCEVACYCTDGSNVAGICSMPQVDVASVTSNNIHQIFGEFGIAAAQRGIEDNLVEAIASSDKHVSRQHIKLIAAAMCFGGYPAPLTFSGMTSHDTATWFKRATFERCLDSFCGAAVRALEDRLQGVSEAIVVGAPIRIGTGGSFDILSDDQKLANEGFVQESRARMTYDVPCIEDFLTNGPSHGLTDESVYLRFDSSKKTDEKRAAGAIRAGGIAGGAGGGGGRKRGRAALALEAREAADAALYFEGKEVERLYFAKGPLVPSSPMLRPRSDGNAGGEEVEALYYGPARLLIPPSPKLRKKNESRKNHRRRFGDREVSMDDIAAMQHLVDAAPKDNKKKTKKALKEAAQKQQLLLTTLQHHQKRPRNNNPSSETSSKQKATKKVAA